MGAPGLKITNFHYSQAFPPYTYQEYPKWIRMEGYEDALSQNADHEAELLARPPRSAHGPLAPAPQPAVPATPEAPARTLQGENDEREILLQIAEERGIKVDKRWRTERLRATVERETAHLDANQ